MSHVGQLKQKYRKLDHIHADDISIISKGGWSTTHKRKVDQVTPEGDIFSPLLWLLIIIGILRGRGVGIVDSADDVGMQWLLQDI